MKEMICRYCGGEVRAVPAERVYGRTAKRRGLEGEYVFQCQNCGARVGCHKGTQKPLGKVANEILRLKRIEAHIGGFEMDQCQRVIELCGGESEEAA